LPICPMRPASRAPCCWRSSGHPTGAIAAPRGGGTGGAAENHQGNCAYQSSEAKAHCKRDPALFGNRGFAGLMEGMSGAAWRCLFLLHDELLNLVQVLADEFNAVFIVRIIRLVSHDIPAPKMQALIWKMHRVAVLLCSEVKGILSCFFFVCHGAAYSPRPTPVVNCKVINGSQQKTTVS
jgi:hypothetical protein